jgi:hypothetical protein
VLADHVARLAGDRSGSYLRRRRRRALADKNQTCARGLGNRSSVPVQPSVPLDLGELIEHDQECGAGADHEEEPDRRKSSSN